MKTILKTIVLGTGPVFLAAALGADTPGADAVKVAASQPTTQPDTQPATVPATQPPAFRGGGVAGSAGDASTHLLGCMCVQEMKMMMKSIVISAVPMLLAGAVGANGPTDNGAPATNAASQPTTQTGTQPSTAPATQAATHPAPITPPMGRAIAGERG